MFSALVAQFLDKLRPVVSIHLHEIEDSQILFDGPFSLLNLLIQVVKPMFTALLSSFIVVSSRLVEENLGNFCPFAVKLTINARL
jgi:hypothetical protein